jgi:hypothetical protein
VASAAELASLRLAIENLLALPAAGQLLQLNSNTCERAYEAYTFSLCCEAVRRAGGTVETRGIRSGPNPNPVVFRGAPGAMYSTDQDFAFARCILKQKVFEIHVDVEYQGTSGALHEIDVSVCIGAHADAVRSGRRTPGATRGKLVMAFECKFYDSTPGVSLGRTFVGLIADCGSLQLNGFISNLPSDGLRMYFSKKSRPEPFLGLSPLDASSEERFIRNVEQRLRKWA